MTDSTNIQIRSPADLAALKQSLTANASEMPGALKVSDVTAEELEMLQNTGRIQGDYILPAPRAATPDLPAAMIPAPTPEVSARIANAKKAESSFVLEDKTLGVVKASADGGEAAKAVAVTELNPDHATAPKEDPIEAADKERFLASLLGADCFKKTYPLFGGKLTVTFRTRTAAQENECANQVHRDERRDGTGGATPDEVAKLRMGRFQQYRFVAALESFGAPGQPARTFHPFKHLKENKEAHLGSIRLATDELLEELPSSLLVALRTTCDKFEVLVARMTMAADSPDFWKADAGT